jgi:hypothetical protein
MNLSDLTPNIEYATTEQIAALAKTVRDIHVAALTGDTPDIDAFTTALTAAINPPHTCGGPSWGRLTPGCGACGQLKRGRAPRRGW